MSTFYKEEKFKETPIGKIPEEWKITRATDVARYINGYAFSPKDWKKKGLPIIRIQNLNDSSTEFNYFDGEIDERYKVENGDLLFSWSASIGVYIWKRGKAVLNQHIFKVVPKSLIDKLFLYYALFLAIEQLKRRIHGSTMKHFRRGELKITFIPLPPLSEQKAIAQILSTIDEAIQKTNEIIEKTERLKKGLMQELLTKGVVLGFMFDTHVFDEILDGKIELPQGLKYYVTHVQLDEIHNMPESKKERREELLKLFNKVPKEIIATEGAIYGISRHNLAKYFTEEDAKLYNEMLEKLKELDRKAGKKKSPENQARDALIALTCIKNCLTLVTNDENLKIVVQEFQGSAVKFKQFLNGEYREFKDTEIRKIPKEWRIARLNEVCIRISDGSHWSPKEVEKSDYRIATVANLRETYIDINSCKFISREDYLRLAREGDVPERGDVLFSKDGTVGISFAFRQDNYNIGLLSSIAIIKPNSQVLFSEFVPYALKSPNVFWQVIGRKTGTALRRITLNYLKTVKIPLPSIQEQKAIAEILTNVDKKLELEKNEKSRLERIKQGLMDLLLTGKIRVKVS